MKIFFYISILIILVCSCLKPKETVKNSNENIEKKSTYIFDSIINICNTAECFFENGIKLKENYKFTDAYLCFKQAIRINRNFVEAYRQAIIVRDKLGFQTIALSTNVLQIDSTVVEAYIETIDYFKESNLDTAFYICENALKILPENNKLLTELAGLWLINRYNPDMIWKKNAWYYLNKSLQMDSIYAKTYYYLGKYYKSSIYESENNFDSAYYYYSKALQLDSTNLDFYFAKNTVCKSPEENLFDINKAIEIFENCGSCYYTRGIEKLFLNDTLGAIEDYRKAIDLGVFDALNKLDFIYK